MPMEYWGIEVKAGETIKVQPGDGMVVHLSQANLGEIKKDKGKESVNVFVNVDGKKLVLCTLSLEKFPQQPFDLVFERDFELSHNLKSGSVSFFGYKARNPVYDDDESQDDGSESDSDDYSEDEIPLTVANNGKPEVKAKEEKTADAKKSDDDKDSAPKNKGKAAIIKSEDSDSDSDDSTSDDDDTDSNEEDDLSDSSDDSGSEEETPAKVEPEKKAEPEKKRSSDSEPKTPAANKKVKLATPQKTDGKSGGTSHVATPHPSKQTEKKPAASSSQKTPKSAGGSHACKSCTRTFGSEAGLEAHTKAKHSAGK